MNCKKTSRALLMLAIASVPSAAFAAVTPTSHITNGVDALGEWVTPTTSSIAFPFDPSTNAGGATLYVDQASSNGSPGGGTLGQTLFLMYDYTHNTTAPTPNSFFDVFFQVPPDSTDYLVRMMGNGTFSAFEKPESTSAPTPGGSFDPNNAPWTPVQSGDLAQAKFQAAIGFGPSHTDPTNHQIAEFQLNINSGGSANPNGIYDPSPAFWSASTGSTAGATVVNDPPISSAIFQLNPNGTTTVTPVLGANNDPILQPLPEPSSALVLGLAGIALTTKRRRRNSVGV